MDSWGRQRIRRKDKGGMSDLSQPVRVGRASSDRKIEILSRVEMHISYKPLIFVKPALRGRSQTVNLTMIADHNPVSSNARIPDGVATKIYSNLF